MIGKLLGPRRSRPPRAMHIWRTKSVKASDFRVGDSIGMHIAHTVQPRADYFLAPPRTGPPITQIGRETVNALTFEPDESVDGSTIKEVAEYLKITKKTAYCLASEGKIPGFKVGGAWWFR